MSDMHILSSLQVCFYDFARPIANSLFPNENADHESSASVWQQQAARIVTVYLMIQMILNISPRT